MAKEVFTSGRIKSFTCSAGKTQTFLWDAKTQGLGLRVTPTGTPAYIFQGEYQGKSLRITIGNTDVWTIPQAQEKARELQRQIDEGRDPRAIKAEKIAKDTALRETERRHAITVGDAWIAYLSERQPHWSERHYKDHLAKSAPGGEKLIRGRGLTKPGPLACFMPLPLRDLDAAKIEEWAKIEGKERPTSARLSHRILKAFLRWCEEDSTYSVLVQAKNPAKTKKTREALGKANAKTDALQNIQLASWFDAIQKIQNKTIASYLQVVLLTGARPGELIRMQWNDVDTQWKTITIRDKVEGERQIPLTPYVEHLLSALPKGTPWVFSSPTSKSGYLTEPTYPHKEACKKVSLNDLTLHGLRRSFKTLTEWLDVPVGVVAQIMGHKPSATAEKHYTVRPIDLLRVHHVRIEAWILEQAGIHFDPKAAQSGLRLAA